MNQTKTAREILAYIEKTFFKGSGLAKASLLKGEERRAYVLSQVDRLLTKKQRCQGTIPWLQRNDSIRKYVVIQVTPFVPQKGHKQIENE